MSLLDGKFIEDASVDLGKLKTPIVSKPEFDAAIQELSSGASGNLDEAVRALNTRITEENQAALSVKGAAYGIGNTFVGAANSPIVVELSQSMRTSDYIVSILPHVTVDVNGRPAGTIPSELASIGTIGYRIVDDKHVAVYNTGSATTVIGFTITAFRKVYIPEDSSDVPVGEPDIPESISEDQLNTTVSAAVSGALNEVASTYATKSSVNNLSNTVSTLQMSIPSTYATKTELTQHTNSATSSYATKSALQDAVQGLNNVIQSSATNASSNYATKSELNQAKLDAEEIYVKLSDLVEISEPEIDAMFNS